MSMQRATVVASAWLLGACAATTPPPRFTPVSPADAGPTAASAAWTPSPAEQEVARLLAQPLTPEAAVRIAFLNNPTLQATFEEVGISQAELAQAGRLENPTFTALVRFPHTGGGRNTEFSLVQNVFDLFARPLRRKVAAAELERSRLRVADAVLVLAMHVKEAWVALQAQQQLALRLAQVRDITGAASTFAEKQYEAGTINELELVSRTVIHREALAELSRAEAAARVERESLNRLLGLWGPRTEWTLSTELPEIPAGDVALPGLEERAMAERQDLKAARWGVDLVGRALALRRRTRFLPVGVSLGIDTEKEITGERVTGPEVSLQLPLFDTGKASVAKLEAEHRRAQRQLEALAIDARAEVREQHAAMLSARERTFYYRSVLLPQRTQILDLTLRYYNAMLKGAYDLLLAKRSEVETEKEYLEAWSGYWIARARLERALGGPLDGPEGR